MRKRGQHKKHTALFVLKEMSPVQSICMVGSDDSLMSRGLKNPTRVFSQGYDKGKDTDIETLQKPLPLTRDTGVWRSGFHQNNYITSSEYCKGKSLMKPPKSFQSL